MYLLFKKVNKKSLNYFTLHKKKVTVIIKTVTETEWQLMKGYHLLFKKSEQKITKLFHIAQEKSYRNYKNSYWNWMTVNERLPTVFPFQLQIKNH